MGGDLDGDLGDAQYDARDDGLDDDLSDVPEGRQGAGHDDALNGEEGDVLSSALADDDNQACALKDRDELIMDAIGLHQSIQVRQLLSLL